MVAVADRWGTGNCGAGPGFGPTANVNAPCTGCPSIEIARQYTRYQPCCRCDVSGTASVSGSAGERVIDPAVRCVPEASVTEMIANRGSTASSKVNATWDGGESRTTLAAGAVRVR